MKLYIKNMACQSCKIVVKEELEELGLTPQKVELGEAEVKESMSPKQVNEFNRAIGKAGLQVIQNKEGILLEKIKKEIHEYVFQSNGRLAVNFSRHLAKALHYSYSYLATLFSNAEAQTIEQYIIKLKIEKAKEMIVLEDYTFTEISHKLNYSSVAHLSAQFKKVTGLTPSHFKQLKENRRMIRQDL